MEINKNFKYLNNILVKFAKKQPINVDEINMCGGRYGMKTYTVCDFLAMIIGIALKTEQKVAVEMFRLFNNGVSDLVSELKGSLSRIGFIESNNKLKIAGADYVFTEKDNKPTFRFKNGNFIKIQSVYKSISGIIPLKGLGSHNGYDLDISVREEANEFNKADVQAINYAIRGAKKSLRIAMSNPDSIFQDYISYCNERLKFDELELLKNGQQKTMIVENGINKIFHYTNYRINNYLRQSNLNEMKELESLDPVKYRSWGIGMPGGLESAIFSHYLKNVDNKEPFRAIRYTSGLDLGQADTPTGHPTALVFVGISGDGRLKPLSEYYHSNAKMKHKSPEEMKNDILQKFVLLANQFPEIQRGHICYVDYGAGGNWTISNLNATKNSYGLYWLDFQPVKKTIWLVKDRVDLIINLLITNHLKLDKEVVPELVKSLSIMEWVKPGRAGNSFKLQVLDLNDDSFDALCYAIMSISLELAETIKRFNPLLVKQKTFELDRANMGSDREW